MKSTIKLSHGVCYMQYSYDRTDSVLLRYDMDSKIYEGFNWKENKWQPSKNAYTAAVGFYDGFLENITESDAEKIINSNNL